MNGRSAGPLSPVSLDGGSEWSGISKYQGIDSSTNSEVGGGGYNSNNNRGQLASPPISSGSNGTMNGGGFPLGRRNNSGDNNGGPNGPSPPASIAARSSNGGGSTYNGSTLYSNSENGRGRKEEQIEAALGEHYSALKRYLSASLRDEKGNPRPNKARDKLLRLSSVQFQELSTDVFDELLRRQPAGRKGDGAPGGPPPFLLPKDTFHPKRNQARQKLSQLPAVRFRDLATDVFYELERRFPRFAGGDISRTDSPASAREPNRNGTPGPGADIRPGSRGGPGGHPGPRIRRPSEASVMSNMSGYPGVRSDSRGGSRPTNGIVPPSPGLPPNDYGRPQPKTFQSNTIVPNKSTMVEDDETGGEDNDDEDAFALESAARARESKVMMKPQTSEADKSLVEDYQTQIAELQGRLDARDEALRTKEEEITKILDGERNRATTANAEKKTWSDLQQQLERQLAEAQNLNDDLQSSLDLVRSDQANTERDFRAQIAQLRETNNAQISKAPLNAELERENDDLRAELRDQQRITDEVRREAEDFLREMRILSDRSGPSWEREDQLLAQVSQLESEVKDWRNRYARTKTQLRSLRASSIGLTIQQDAAKYAKNSGFTQEDGLVRDVNVTKFQIAIDELLQIARTQNPERVVEYMKNVVVAVRSITQDIDASTINPSMAAQQSKLKTRVSATANNLITASKNFANAKGISPLSILDAAASHLTAAVVELVRTVKIRPTPAGELEDDDDGRLTPEDPTGFFPVNGRESAEKVNGSGGRKSLTNGVGGGINGGVGNANPDGAVNRGNGNTGNLPTPFLGLRDRNSNFSSVYSPLNSPRESTSTRPRSSSVKDGGGWGRRPGSRGASGGGMNGLNGTANINNNKNLPSAPVGFGIRTQESDVEDLKLYLDTQTALLVSQIQTLVTSIRSDSGITTLSTSLSSIATIVSAIVTSTQSSMSLTGNSSLRISASDIVDRLGACGQRVEEMERRGRQIADMAEGGGEKAEAEAEREWRVWTQGLPPVAFEVARETKGLVQVVDRVSAGAGGGTGDGEGGGEAEGEDEAF